MYCVDLDIETVAVQHAAIKLHDGSLRLILHHHVLQNTSHNKEHY